MAERVDRAVSTILEGGQPGSAMAAAGLAAAERPIVETAGFLRSALTPPAVASRFEARLEARLAAGVHPRDAMSWILRHPGRLIVTGAVGSAVGVGVTAYAVWRSGRRPGGAYRLLHR